jgi:hypothetical protein
MGQSIKASAISRIAASEAAQLDLAAMPRHKNRNAAKRRRLRVSNRARRGRCRATVDAFQAADSMGRYFNASIKGHFDCQTGRVPSYQ